MARKSSRGSDQQAKVQIHRTHAIAEAVSRIIAELAKWGTLAFIAWLFAPAFTVAAAAWAGKETVARLSFEWVMSEHMAQLLALIFGGGGVFYGNSQARLRRSAIERLHKYQQEHEQNIDPNRSSSRLTPTGETRVEDA